MCFLLSTKQVYFANLHYLYIITKINPTFFRNNAYICRNISIMKKKMFMAAVLLMAAGAQAQKRVEKPATDVPVERGRYTASWAGTADWECPIDVL